MKLARIFGDYMVLQRGMPIRIWGSCDKAETISVKLNGQVIREKVVRVGTFSFHLPPIEAMEDVTLEIGEYTFHHVDIGEVWIAGGQSNMEFMLQYATGGEEEIASADDPHLRHYTVGQYSFAGEREMGYKAWNPWDKWYSYCPEHAAEFSAVAVYFAKDLRKTLGVPVGIINCSWGGTSASAWMDKERILNNPAIRSYMDDFDNIVANLDLERFNRIKSFVRPGMASPESKKMMSIILKHTFKPGQLEQMMVAGNQQQEPAALPENGLDVTHLSIADIMAVGPGDPNEPGTLYENMVREIAGYTVKGIIWYQGETDEIKADCYAELFSELINCWRKSWNQDLPFLFVQLAPFGIWRGSDGNRFPTVRAQQEKVSQTVSGVYMASISDVGNVYDIHPKEKKTVGYRLALLARKHIYDETVASDAPEAISVEKSADMLLIRFKNANELTLQQKCFDSYNGFPVSEIDPGLLPPVLDGVNGLRVTVNEKSLQQVQCAVSGNILSISSNEISGGKTFRIEFANTGFYQVNLYNEAGIPVKPFVISKEETLR